MGNITKICSINMVIFLSILCFAGLCCEIYVRYCLGFNDETHWPAKVEPGVGLRFIPGTVCIHSNYMDYITYTRVNSLGFLDREPSCSINSSQVRIAVVGDSFVEAVQVPIENKFHVSLEKKLNDHGMDCTTMAFGYSGTGQAQQIAYYDHIARKFNPKIVILVVTGNDFSNNNKVLEALRNGFHPDHQPWFTVNRMANDERLLGLLPPDIDFWKYKIDKIPVENKYIKFIYKHSMAWRYVVSRLQHMSGFNRGFVNGIFTTTVDERLSILKNMDIYPELAYETTVTLSELDRNFNRAKISALYKQGISDTKYAFAEWKKRALRDNFQLIVYLNNTVSQNCDDSMYLKRMKTLLDELGIDFYDQCDFLREKQIDARHVRFDNDGHWNDFGHETAAEHLCRIILQPATQIN